MDYLITVEAEDLLEELLINHTKIEVHEILQKALELLDGGISYEPQL